MYTYIYIYTCVYTHIYNIYTIIYLCEYIYISIYRYIHNDIYIYLYIILHLSIYRYMYTPWNRTCYLFQSVDYIIISTILFYRSHPHATHVACVHVYNMYLAYAYIIHVLKTHRTQMIIQWANRKAYYITVRFLVNLR